ncbi:MAG TPA: superoxide dismutase family protein [Allosphingosinicella sp.]|jgi:Cu-Zn family superoxide dismutase|uniref:superoxide dismutase family protein n=1 Tax=Allosphingosinicella sp. TaxID=2823234 RepID=UPI002F294B72
MALQKISSAGLALALLSGCTAGETTLGQPASLPATASADLRNSAGQVDARATASQSGNGIRIRLEAAGMQRGTYAAHVHTTGACTPPDFTSAGPHWNPTAAQHGKNNPAGMHKGDLPNLSVGTDGRGSLEFVIAGAALSGDAGALLDADGAAVVIHAQADDYQTDPSGNAGARIACGVFR